MELPPIALADPPPRASWERTSQGGSSDKDVFADSENTFLALLDAMAQSASGSMVDLKRLKERAAAQGGAVALCRLPDAAASGPMTVVRFDPPAAGFGLQDDAAISDGLLFLGVPDTAGTAILQPAGVGGAPLNVAWGASESGRSTCRIVD
jgi:hypothetical protein